MPVNPYLPERNYTGADHQEWQREHRRLNPPPPPVPTPPPFAAPPPFNPAPYSPAPAPESLNDSTMTLFPVPQQGSWPPPHPAQHPATRRNKGIVATMGEQTGKLSVNIVQHIAPLRASIQLGERLADAGPRAKGFCAVLCGVVCAAIAAGADLHGPGVLSALVLGAVIGWFLPLIAGSLLALGAALTGVAIALSLIAIVIAAIVVLLKAITA